MPASTKLDFEPEMILIPTGEFLMGSDTANDECAHARETPQHVLFLPDYSLAKTPITNAHYAAFVYDTGHRAPDHWQDGVPQEQLNDHPVVHVSWHDALAYCRWLSDATNRSYRLPSEAEWEKGASWEERPRTPSQGRRAIDAGRPMTAESALTGKKRRYPWGDEFQVMRCNTKESAIGDTTPVGAHPQGASPYGLLDMAGNIYEWTLSLWGRDMKEPVFGYPYNSTDGREDVSAGNGVLRVLRGGAFYYDAFYARSTHRVKSYPDYRVRTRGFRVCMESD